jgi:ketosteroid isomerase-like protein
VTSANVETVQRVFEHWARGDYRWTDWADPDIEFVFVDGPTPGTWHGLSGLANAWREFLGAWEGFRSVLEEARELDADRVLTLARYEGRGRLSGVHIQDTGSNSAGLFHFRNGKATKLAFYFSRARAFADLGLSTDPAD